MKSSLLRKAFQRTALTVMAASLLIPAAALAEGSVDGKAGVGAQLVADRKQAGAGGSVSYHLIYHNVESQSRSNVWLKLKVPEGMEPDDLGGGIWDAATGTIRWIVKELPGNVADIVHFSLKLKADVKAGTAFEAVAEVGADGGASVKLPSVRLVAGPQIDQPFFDGFPDGKFHPEANMTRAETAAVVARIENLETRAAPAVSYTDVPASHWASSYIVKVTQAGYMEGDEGSRFRPDDPITRAELVALVLRMRGVKPVPLPDLFTDLNNHWAHDAVNTAKGLRFVEGLGLLFGPDAAIRRDDAAKLIDIGLSRGPLEDGDAKVVQHFPDVLPSDWSFRWIEEASMTAHESVVGADGKERLIRYLPDQTEPF